MIEKRLTDEKLYEKNAYLFDFSATVRAVYKDGDKTSVVLSETAFFPEGGGQIYDTGTLDGLPVVAVHETERGVEHTVCGPVSFSAGDTVRGHVDGERRLDLMRCHTAEHMLSGVIFRLFGYDNVGFHLSCETMTVDTSGTLTAADIERVEDEVNRAVMQNIPVEILYLLPDEKHEISYRCKLDFTETVRIVRIGDVDTCACCAPHVHSTGEIGYVKITDSVRWKGGMRLTVKAGARAFADYRNLFCATSDIGRCLSVPREETAAAVRRQTELLTSEKATLKNAVVEVLTLYSDAFVPDGDNAVLVFSSVLPTVVRSFAETVAKKVRQRLVLLFPKGDGYDYLIASETVPLKEDIHTVNAALAGRGGGTDRMVQGHFSATENQIRTYFNGIGSVH